MRTTVLQDLEGRVNFIPNRAIKSVTNRTYVWGRAVLEMTIGLRKDVDRVMGIILEVEEKIDAHPESNGWIIDKPLMLGQDRFSEYGLIVKIYVQTPPDKLFPRRELLRRIKKRFDEEGIEIAAPHRILLQPTDGEYRVAQT